MSSFAKYTRLLLMMTQPESDDWNYLNGWVDPPPAPSGFKIEVQTCALLGVVTAYRFIPIEGASPC